MPKQSHREKINAKDNLPQIKSAPEKWGGGQMLIPHPKDIEALMCYIPKGKVLKVETLRQALAKQFKVNVVCPMTTGIFINLVAKAVDEEKHLDTRSKAPYWRVIKAKGELNIKYPGGAQAQAALLLKEGFSSISTGKTLRLLDFENRLYTP